MKTAKLFHYGQSQAVRLPKELRFEDDQVIFGDILCLLSLKCLI